MLRERFLVLTHAPNYARKYENIILKHLSMDVVLWRSCNSSSTRSMNNDSMLQSNAGLSFSQMSASRLSSERIKF